MNNNVIQDLKNFNWQTIVDFGNSLDDLNDAQWRFLKGLVAELTVEKHADNDLQYVGAPHKDYDWPKHNLTVELKSQLSGPMYKKNGQMRKTFSIKLNNSNGTNKNAVLLPAHVADILIVIRDDGAFALDKTVVLENAKHGGDGFEVIINNSQIIELTGKIDKKITYTTNLKQIITNAIRQALP